MSTLTSGPRGPYAKTARVRQRILDSCAEVFAESGFRATTMKEVASRAGISERGLSHHFANKAEMLFAILDRTEERNTELVPHEAGMSVLLAMADIVAADRERPGMVELHTVLSAEATSADHPAHEHYRSRYEIVRDAAELSFAALRAQGAIVSGLDDAALAAAFVALSDGLQLQWLYEPERIDSSAVLRGFLSSLVPPSR